jgi:hypothetical protein
VTKNNALRGITWIGLLLLINATPLARTVNELILGILDASEFAGPSYTYIVIAIVFWTMIVTYLSRRVVAIWGEAEEVAERERVSWWSLLRFYGGTAAALVVVIVLLNVLR